MFAAKIIQPKIKDIYIDCYKHIMLRAIDCY